MSHLWNPQIAPVYDEQGRIADGALAYFYLANTSEKLTVYQDYELTTPHAWPVVADYNGVFPPVFIDFIDYRMRITTAAHYPLRDVPRVGNPAPPSSGGGGGVSVSADEIFQTGDVMFNFTGTARSGWVRMNGRTVGNASSGATEYANSAAQDLFSYLWNALPNSLAPVSGGRGASASADWSANKTIVVPDMRGRAPVGADDMGASAANTIQVSGTCTVTNGSPTITVASATGLARGMAIIIDSIASGMITAISGTTVTLDAAYAGTSGAGKSFRASFFPDAQLLGGYAGAQTAAATLAEMPAHTHSVTDPGHDHGLNFIINYAAGASAGATNGGGSSGNTTTDMTGISVQSSGQGLPSSIMQPSRLVTFYMKL